MIVWWSLVMGLPLLAYGATAAIAPAKAKHFNAWFKGSRNVAAVLTVVAWYWTAFECSTIGIDVFDSLLLKAQTGGFFVWILATVLAYLTIIWMPKNLPVRALTGVLMLIPAELFKTTRLLVGEGGFSVVHPLVVTAYIGAIIGMYGMFYPWRLEKGMGLLESWRIGGLDGFRMVGGVLAVWGAVLIALGFFA